MTDMLYQKKKYKRNLDNERYIKNRYNYYRDLFTEPDSDKINNFIKCKSRSFFDHGKGTLTGMASGYNLGLAIGGKWGGSGGWIVGGILQIVCLCVAPVFGMCHGAFTGILLGEADTIYLFRDYNYTYNSTMPYQIYKIPVNLDPKNNISEWVKYGDKQINSDNSLTSGQNIH